MEVHAAAPAGEHLLQGALGVLAGVLQGLQVVLQPAHADGYRIAGIIQGFHNPLVQLVELILHALLVVAAHDDEQVLRVLRAADHGVLVGGHLVADVGDQRLRVLILLHSHVAAGHVHQRQHEAGLAQADELLVGKDLQLLLVHPAPQQGVEHPLPGVGGDGHHALPVAVALADEPPDALQDVVDLVGIAAGALDHLANGADGLVVFLRQPVRHPDEQKPDQRQTQHRNHHRAQQRRREGSGGGVDAVLQPGRNHAVRREGEVRLLPAGEEGILPVQYAEARRVRQGILRHGLQTAQLQQHQHRPFGRAAVGVGGVVEGGVVVGVDQVLLVHDHAARVADSQQLRYRGHPDVGPLRQQGAFSLHGDHRPGGV